MEKEKYLELIDALDDLIQSQRRVTSIIGELGGDTESMVEPLIKTMGVRIYLETLIHESGM